MSINTQWHKRNAHGPYPMLLKQSLEEVEDGWFKWFILVMIISIIGMLTMMLG